MREHRRTTRTTIPHHHEASRYVEETANNDTRCAALRLPRAALTVALVFISVAASPASSSASSAEGSTALRGTVANGGRMSMIVDASGSRLIRLKFRARWRCADGIVDTLTVTALSVDDPETITNGKFSTTVIGHSDRFALGGRAVIKGSFSPTGAAGTLSGVERSRHHGLCKTGRLAWAVSHS